MTIMSTAKVATDRGITGVVLLHLVPGLLFLLAFLPLARLFSSWGAPSLLAVYTAGAMVLIPFFAVVLLRAAASSEGPTHVIHYRDRLSRRMFLLLAGGTLGWAVLVFAAIGPLLAGPIQASLFGWVPGWVDFAGQYAQPEQFSREWLLLTWAVGLVVGSIAIPVMEELYFRGYLLPRLERLGRWAPVVNTVLFAVYHFTQPWLIPTRVLATLPLFYVVWWKRNVAIGIAVHVALNLVGDSLLTVPPVFG